MTATVTPPRTRVMHAMTAVELIDHTPTVREVVFRAQGEGICFKAGQFCTLHIPAEPKAIMRAYSFASSENDGKEFRLIFKKVDNGVASNFIWNFKGGETANFTGPFGRLFFKEPPTKQIVFLNTGSGISQHYSYLLSKKDQFPNLSYRLLFGIRNEGEIFYRKELDDLKKSMPDFKYDFVLSRPSPEWTGKKGYVQHFLSEFDYKNIDTTFYLCGNGGMIKEVKHQLIEKDGFDKTRILAEAFN